MDAKFSLVERDSRKYMIKKIISGGQTGVDQAALDAAIAHGMQYGGWLPAGRRTENGPLSARYTMQVLTTGGYPDRTRKNILDSDGTLIITKGPLTGGSALTARIANNRAKPLLHIDLTLLDNTRCKVILNEWLRNHQPESLNIAGPRASSDATIYDNAFALVSELLKFNDLL